MSRRVFPISETTPTFRRSEITACAVLLLIAALAYLPLVSQLGYYHDDWFTVASRVSGVSLSDMHYVDRPFMGEVYQITHAVLGDRPLNWHLFAFAVRYIGALAFYALVRMVWPRQRLAVVAMAALFVVYPGFLMQPNANNYQNHLIALALGMISLALSILALRITNPAARIFLLLSGAGLVLFYPRIYEAMIGLEGLRWVLFGFLLLGGGEPWRVRIRRLVLVGAPFLVATGAFLAWRFFVFNSVRLGTDAGLLMAQYSSQPLRMAAHILLETGKDFIETVFFAWAVPLSQSLARVGTVDQVIALALALLGMGVWAVYRRGQIQDTAAGFAAGREMAQLGAVAVLLMLLPATLSGRDVQYSYNLNRYTLPAAGGVAILGVGLVTWLLPARPRGWAVAVLLGLALATQYSNAVYFRDFWAQQRQFWWQVAWRAPGLEQETVLVGMLPPGYRAAEDFEIWAPANLIYYPHPGMGANDPIGVMAYLLTPEAVPQIRSAEVVPRNFRQISYIRRLEKTLVFSMSTPAACVHLLDGRQVELPLDADRLVQQVAKYSKINEIKTGAEPAIPPAELFGQEPARGWCYYYQKAGLARQKEDWQTVARLGEEAGRLGLAPKDVSEWLPFYQAAFHLDRQAQAFELAEKIRSDTLTWKSFCGQFTELSANRNPALAALCRKSQE